jgi:hypothetical protein
MNVRQSGPDLAILRCVWLGVFALNSVWAVASAGQESRPPWLKIEIADELVANPGGEVPIVITSPARAKFLQVIVSGEAPLPSVTDSITELPGKITLEVGPDVRPGKYKLTAVGTTVDGQMVESPPAILDVQTRDKPVSLSAEPARIDFASCGQQQPVTVWGTYSDGSIVDVTAASQLVFASSNPDVVMLDDRIFSGVGEGSAIVTASYGGAASPLRVSIPISVPAPSVVPAPSILYFDQQTIGQHSPRQSVSLSNEGKIDLQIESISVHGEFSTTDNCVSSSPLPPGGSCSIDVVFSPSKVGTQNGIVEIKNNAMMVSARVRLTGKGTASAFRQE